MHEAIVTILRGAVDKRAYAGLTPLTKHSTVLTGPDVAVARITSHWGSGSRTTSFISFCRLDSGTSSLSRPLCALPP